MEIDISKRLIISRPLYLEDNECGYCHHEKKRSLCAGVASWGELWEKEGILARSISMGFQVERMSVHQYDSLMRSGFRRSGTFVYKPDQLRGCCRMYTIRSNVGMLKITKEHKKAINRLNKAVGNAGNAGVFDLEREVGKFELSGKLRIVTTKSEFTIEKYQLFQKYQETVHNDKKTSEKSFKRFLCDTPFAEEDGEEVQYGALHMCYYLDDKLIAVGFLDRLPSGVSSVYFIYDPEYKHLGLGTVSALKEIVYTQQQGLQYYYLGYYIEDCDKMRYKRKFGGELLNLLDYKFYSIDFMEQFISGGRLALVEPLEKSDIAEELYGVDGGAFKEGGEYIRRWALEGVFYQNNRLQEIGDEQKKSVYNVPAVVPGLRSLRDAHEKLHTGEFNGLLLFGATGFRLLDWNEETEEIKRAVLDVYRLVLDSGLVQNTVLCL